jgi:hypothetical protein
MAEEMTGEVMRPRFTMLLMRAALELPEHSLSESRVKEGTTGEGTRHVSEGEGRRRGREEATR